MPSFRPEPLNLSLYSFHLYY